MAHFVPSTSRMSGAESSTEHAECAQSSRRKNLNSLEQKIRSLEKQRKELLEVNQQWDQQFRSMKELYERKVAELKTKLDAAEKVLGTLEKERQPSLRESGARSDQTWEKLREEVGGARGAPPRPQERAGLRLQTVENRPFNQIYCLPSRTDVQGCTGCASPPSQK